MISIYLLQDKKLNETTQKQIITWTEQAINKRMIPILAGDFNIDLERKIQNNPLISFLKSNNMLPLVNTLKPGIPT